MTISNSVPTANRINGSLLRFVVQTDSSVQYGSPGGTGDPDDREGLTVYGYRTMNSIGDMISQFTIPGTATTSGTNEWQFLTLNSGYINVDMGFEDSQVTAPTSDYHTGFYNIFNSLPEIRVPVHPRDVIGDYLSPVHLMGQIARLLSLTCTRLV